MLALNILPILIGVLFWGVVLFYFSSDLLGVLEHLLPLSWQKILASQGILAGIGSALIAALLYILLGFFVIILALIGNVFIAIFYTPLAIKYLHKKYYPNLQISSFGGIGEVIGHYIKYLVYFILSTLILIPLYFIPLIGVFAILIPHFFFFKNTMFFDVGSSIFEVSDYHHTLKTHKISHYQISIIAYLFALIPVFNLFATLLQTLIIARYFLEIKQNRASKQP
ncbi:peptidase [Helicobacter sp. 12S02634-8]|nr:peptidase [Helicobacter sp. 12S02634-8]